MAGKPLIIGITALLLTAVGLHLGRMVGSISKVGSRVEVMGGLVLIAIGFRILWEHGVFK